MKGSATNGVQCKDDQPLTLPVDVAWERAFALYQLSCSYALSVILNTTNASSTSDERAQKAPRSRAWCSGAVGAFGDNLSMMENMQSVSKSG